MRDCRAPKRSISWIYHIILKLMPPPSQSTHGRGPGQYTSSVVSDGTDSVVVGGPDVDDRQLLIDSRGGSCVERVTASDWLSEFITRYQITRVGRGGRPEGIIVLKTHKTYMYH